jgi:hypothetical protein
LPQKEEKKTGINYLDELDPEEQAGVLKRSKQFWDSLTVEERARNLNAYYTMIREKMKSKGGMITKEEAI